MKRGNTRAENMSKGHTRKTSGDTSPCLCYSNLYIPTAENAKARCVAGIVAGGRTMHVPGMSVAGLCARCVPAIKWHRIAL